MTLRTVLLSLQALLAAAEPDDPQDAVVANQFRENHEMFCKTAKVCDLIYSANVKCTFIHRLQHWTNVYAKGPHKFPDFDQKVQRLRDMGVSEFDARAALSRHNWDLNLATNDIF
jgi:ubiquitin-conjugating enzyme (huntingtin interacting protein 2)